MSLDNEAVSRLLGSLYDAAAGTTSWGVFLGQLALTAGATSAALVIRDVDHSSCTVSGSWQLDPELNRRYQEHYHAEDVWAKKARVMPV